MHLIAPLSAGIPQAPLGTAILTLRDTANDAPYWTDFEGLVAGPTGTPVALNSYGQAEVYVNALVDVVVKNSAGVTVREFTVGNAAPNVEVRSASFTGNPYGVGGAAAGQPTTLQAVLDLWLAQSGSIDWKVLVNGTSYTLAAALSSAALGIVFNVKSTVYAGGAVGDGANNDYAAVAAAVAAASSAGGGIVWFPPGTYRLGTALTVPDKVTLLGAGPGASNILIGQAAAAGVELLAGSVGQHVAGLKFTHAAASAFHLLLITGTTANIENCMFDGASTTTTLLGTTSASAIVLNIDNCRFYPAASQRGIDTSSVTAANTRAHITRSYVRAPAANGAQDLFKCWGAVYNACTIDMSQVNGGSPRGIDGSRGGIVSGCRFLDAALGITWYGLRCPEEGTGFTFTESANEFGQGIDALNGHAYDFTATEAILQSRDGRWIEITESVNAGNVTVLLKEFGRCEHYNSSNNVSANTIVADSVGPKHAGADLLLRKNAAGGAQTLSSTWFEMTVNPVSYTTNPSTMGVRLFNPGHANLGARWHVLDAVEH